MKTTTNDEADLLPELSSPNSARGKLQRIALKWLQQKNDSGEIPTSLRFLFYELEQQGHVSKTPLRLDGKPKKRKPDSDLMEAVTWLRDKGIIPWDWIVDESRSVNNWNYAPSVHEYVARSARWARIDPWLNGMRPVLVTESRGIGGILSRGIAQDYLVAVAATGGMCRGFLVNEVAQLLEDEDTMVLYVGDFDLAGNQIEDNSRRVLEQHTGRKFDETSWQRVALTKEQTDDLKARGVKPIRKKDRRCKDSRPHWAFEAEAVGQATIIQIVRDRLDELLPEPLERVQEREIRQRAEVLRLLTRKPR